MAITEIHKTGLGPIVNREILPSTYHTTDDILAELRAKLNSESVRRTLRTSAYAFRSSIQKLRFKSELIRESQGSVLLLDFDVIWDYISAEGGPKHDSGIVRTIIESQSSEYAIPIGAFYELIDRLLKVRVVNIVLDQHYSPENAISEIAKYLSGTVAASSGASDVNLRIIQEAMKSHIVVVRRLIALLDSHSFQGVVATAERKSTDSLKEVISKSVQRQSDREYRDKRDAMNLSIATRSHRASSNGPKYLLLTSTRGLYDLLNPSHEHNDQDIRRCISEEMGLPIEEVDTRYPVMSPYEFWVGKQLVPSGSDYELESLDQVTTNLDDIIKLSEVPLVGQFKTDVPGTLDRLCDKIISMAKMAERPFGQFLSNQVIEGSAQLAKQIMYPRVSCEPEERYPVDTLALAHLLWKLRLHLLDNIAKKFTSSRVGSFSYFIGFGQEGVVLDPLIKATIYRNPLLPGQAKVYSLSWKTVRSIGDCLFCIRRFVFTTNQGRGRRSRSHPVKFRKIVEATDDLLSRGVVAFTSLGVYGTGLELLNHYSSWSEILFRLSDASWKGLIADYPESSDEVQEYPIIRSLKIITSDYEFSIDITVPDYSSGRSVSFVSLSNDFEKVSKVIETTGNFRLLKGSIVAELNRISEAKNYEVP